MFLMFKTNYSFLEIILIVNKTNYAINTKDVSLRLLKNITKKRYYSTYSLMN